MAKEEAEAGRLTGLSPIEQFPVKSFLLHPRFPVIQSRLDGTLKVRDVDHFSWCAGRSRESVNGCTTPSEKLRHDTLDSLGEAMSKMVAMCNEVPGLFKADIKAAYRRVPIRKERRWACGLAFVSGGQIYAASHAACPFGAVASVHAWER